MALSILMAAIAILGFWPTYFGPLVRATLAQPIIIHWHALVFSGWLALFFAQVVFAATGRIALHMRLGRIGIAYGILLIGMGLATGIIRAGALEDPRGARLLMSAISDMAVFALFFGVAIAYRKKPQVHKRAMVVAATMLLIAAVSRLWFLPELSSAVQRPAFFLIWFFPILCAIAYDLAHKQRVHVVYIVGMITLAVRATVVRPLSQTEAWLRFADGIFEFFNI